MPLCPCSWSTAAHSLPPSWPTTHAQIVTTLPIIICPCFWRMCAYLTSAMLFDWRETRELSPPSNQWIYPRRDRGRRVLYPTAYLTKQIPFPHSGLHYRLHESNQISIVVALFLFIGIKIQKKRKGIKRGGPLFSCVMCSNCRVQFFLSTRIRASVILFR